MENDESTRQLKYDEIIAEAKRILFILKNNIKNMDFEKEEEKLNSILKSGMNGLGKTLKYRSRLMIAKLLTRVINGISQENNPNPNLQSAALQLEELLKNMGFGLYEMPVGQVYDVNIDEILSNVSKIKRTKSTEKGKEIPLYISNSTFGCSKHYSDGSRRVVEKATIELSDVAPSMNSGFSNLASEKI